MAAEKRHRWVGAAEVVIPHTSAARAAERARFVIPAAVVVTVHEVYCSRCRRAYSERLAQSECSLGSQHIGGPRKREDEEEPARVGA